MDARKLTRRAALACLGSGAAVAISGSFGFDSVTAGRGVSVSTASGLDALVGLNVNSPVKKNNQEELIDIKNNTGQTLDLQISLDDCGQGTLYGPNGSGCTVDVSISPSVIETVEIEASVADTISFTIETPPDSGSADLEFEATRETTAETGNTGPNADADGPYRVDETDSVELDGSNSSGSSLSYSWQITNGGGGTLDNADTSTPVYNAPSVQKDTTVTVELTVTDNKGNQSTDSATISVDDKSGSPPEFDSNSPTVEKTGSKNRTLEITASVSDADGNLDRVKITVTRTQNGKEEYSNDIRVSGSSDSIRDTTTQLGNTKEYRVDVTVYDDSGLSTTATRTLTTG